jgi:hypothetical protein
MGPIGIYLVWTLVNGSAVDVDAFLGKNDCQEFLVASESRRQAAVAQHPSAATYSYLGCIPMTIEGPPLAGEKS